MTIEAVQYDKWRFDAPDLMDQQYLLGYYENIPEGEVKVELWVGRYGVIMVSALVISLSDGNQCPG